MSDNKVSVASSGVADDPSVVAGPLESSKSCVLVCLQAIVFDFNEYVCIQNSFSDHFIMSELNFFLN